MRQDIGRSAVFALCALLTIGAGAAVHAQEKTISKMEIRKDDPERTHERLRDIFWGSLEMEDRRTDADPERDLSNVWFESKMFPTRVPGLCRYDTLRIEFERIEGDYDTPTAQARPVGFRSSSFFKFVDPPKDDWLEIVRNDGLIGDACEAVDKDDVFFSAPDAQMATDGYVSFVAMIRMAQAGQTEHFECQFHPKEKIECGALIAGFRADAIRAISRCDADAGYQCFEFSIDDRAVRVVSPFRWPEDVMQVRLESLIVLSHEVID